MPQFFENYLGYLLARAELEANKPFHDHLKTKGISLMTWRVLASIRNEPTSVNELAKRVLVNQSTLSKALDRFERDELLSRARDSKQHRRINVSITTKGKELIDNLIPIAREHEERAFQYMSAEEKLNLKTMLQKLIEHHG
jgi:DNA-binding MarR family transcriptional regulator